MNKLAKNLADWEIRYQFKSPHSELFIAENCTASQAWYRFLSLIPEEKRGYEQSKWSLKPVEDYDYLDQPHEIAAIEAEETLNK